MLEILLGVLILCGIVVLLCLLILNYRRLMIGSGAASVSLNGARQLTVPVGQSLLEVLEEAGIPVPAVCGGRGTCGQCRISVTEGGGELRPAEVSLLSPVEQQNEMRLACQVTVREDMKVRVPEHFFAVHRWRCLVRSNRNVATFIKELVLELPTDEPMEFQAGEYVLVECPPYETNFSDFDIDSAFREEWDRMKLWRYQAGCREETKRAYSMANYPGEPGIVMLNVRIALPPPGATLDIPAGIVSSFIFSRTPGDTVWISGPYGDFLARDSQKEMVLLGGGAGMAPMRAHILDQLKRLESGRKIVFWYGARSLQEVFYADLFDRLDREHTDFSWHLVLSDARPEDKWSGLTGFVHEAAYEHYLKDHPSLEDCEFYICGPPLMNQAILRLLDDLGIDPGDIFLDDFGS